MTVSALNVTFDDDAFSVELLDGRSIRVPLIWFPRLLHATPEQRARYELSHSGIHWEAIDEDISVDGLLAGRGDVTNAVAGYDIAAGGHENNQLGPSTACKRLIANRFT